MFKRFAVLLGAYLLMALGISLQNNALLGSPPIGSLPYALFRITGLSVGSITFLMNMVFLAGQKAMLGPLCGRAYFWQIPATLLFSVMIDLGMWLSRPLINDVYALQTLMVLGGCLILAAGIFLQISCALVFLPADGMAAALSQRFGWNFGRSKIGLDLFLMSLSVIASWLALGEVVGVREGTLAAALLLGNLIRFFLDRWGASVRAWLGV